MPIRTILVVVDPISKVEMLLDAALEVARRMEGHLEVLYLQPELTELVAHFSYPEFPFPLAELEAVNERARTAMLGRFEAWREIKGLPERIVKSMLRSTFAQWSTWDGSPVIGLLRRARLADLVVMATPGEVSLTADLVDAALFDSGRPVLLMPNVAKGPLLERVAVAWNSSLEAVRSLAAVMPFLHEAERAEVFSLANSHPVNADPSMISVEEVVEGLSWQGVQSRAVHIAAKDGESAGEALLREADTCGISLMALGAFTHSRIRGTAVGGVTGYVLKHAKIPLLMTH